MFKKVINLMYKCDPYTNWSLVGNSNGELRDLLLTIYYWIDDNCLEKTEEIEEIIDYLEVKIK